MGDSRTSGHVGGMRRCLLWAFKRHSRGSGAVLEVLEGGRDGRAGKIQESQH